MGRAGFDPHLLRQEQRALSLDYRPRGFLTVSDLQVAWTRNRRHRQAESGDRLARLARRDAGTCRARSGFSRWARLDSNQGPTDYELASSPRAAETQRDLSLLGLRFPLWWLRAGLGLSRPFSLPP